MDNDHRPITENNPEPATPMTPAPLITRPITVNVDDDELPLLPLLLAAMDERELSPDDFPNEQALAWPEQRQLIEKAIRLADAGKGRIEQALYLAFPIGFPRSFRGGRAKWALERWIAGVEKLRAEREEPEHG